MRTWCFIKNQLGYCVLQLSALEWCHLVILACSDTFVVKRIPKIACRTGCQTAVWISLPKNYDVQIHQNWTIWITTSGKIFQVNHRITKHWRYRRAQRNAANDSLTQGTIDRAVRVFKTSECLCLAKGGHLLFTANAMLCCFISFSWTTQFAVRLLGCFLARQNR